MSDYWIECVSVAFEDAGIEATNEQIQSVAGDVEAGFDNYGMAHGHGCIPNPLLADLEASRKESRRLEDEVDKANLNFKQNVARRHRVDTSSVILGDNGDATFHK